MSIKIGNLDISAFKVGSADCKVYLGDTLLYPTTPSFQGKWLATYTGGTTSSADCDASSAITQNEITLTDLVSVQIGDCVTSIGNNAFYRCSGLTNIDIPDSVTTIDWSAFERCTSLTSVTIGTGITRINEDAFRYCSGLTSITVNATTPPTLETYSVFGSTNNCPIYVPCDSVETYKTTGYWINYASRITCVSPAFQGKWIATYTGGTTSSAECGSSSAITYNEINLTNLVSVEIGDCVTTIGDNAFQNCSSLTTVTIGSGITSIGTEAFYTCYNLTSITILATTPPTLGMFSLNMSDDCPIYVPAASVNAYQSASAEWSKVSYRIQAIPNS